jgi:tRNA-dihydrouridine synthase
MKFYLAPLEGITTYTYRQTQKEIFGGFDKYFTPFISATSHLHLKNKDANDIAPKNNQGIYVVPQILANSADTLLWAMQECGRLGYQEVNLNLGCPSPTVVSKHKGAGLLQDLTYLEEMLDRVFKMKDKDMALSIKTRIGYEDDDHVKELMHLYNRYPISELIIHPRTMSDRYKKPVRLDDFAMCLEESRHKIVYNGNILDVASYEDFTKRFPQIETIMIGRGCIADPDLVRQIKTGEMIDADKLETFLMLLFDRYKVRIDGVGNTLMKMKELWFYLQTLFIFEKRDLKKILKAKTEDDYKNAVHHFLAVSPLDERALRDLPFR